MSVKEIQMFKTLEEHAIEAANKSKKIIIEGTIGAIVFLAIILYLYFRLI